jgi:hypothetical protein
VHTACASLAAARETGRASRRRSCEGSRLPTARRNQDNRSRFAKANLNIRNANIAMYLHLIDRPD